MYRKDETETNSNEQIEDINDEERRYRIHVALPRPSKVLSLHSNISSLSSQSPSTETAELDRGTPKEELGPYDVVCGRNKLAFNNIGNRRFRVTVSLTLDRYMTATNRNDTSNVIKYVANIVRGNGGRFLKLSNNGSSWVDLDEKQVHEKVGHALRDAAAAKKESESSRRFQTARNLSLAQQHRTDNIPNVATQSRENVASLSRRRSDSLSIDMSAYAQQYKLQTGYDVATVGFAKNDNDEAPLRLDRVSKNSGDDETAKHTEVSSNYTADPCTSLLSLEQPQFVQSMLQRDIRMDDLPLLYIDQSLNSLEEPSTATYTHIERDNDMFDHTSLAIDNEVYDWLLEESDIILKHGQNSE
jgi:hypothetical protein